MGKHRNNPNRPPPAYPTGYRVPPEGHKFPAGVSGNPKGRPKKRKTVGEEIEEILSETITVSENGRRTRMTRQRVIFRSIVTKAMAGDARAAGFLFGLHAAYQDAPDTVIDTEKLSPEDLALLDDFLRRNRSQESQAAEAVNNEEDGGDA